MRLELLVAHRAGWYTVSGREDLSLRGFKCQSIPLIGTDIAGPWPTRHGRDVHFSGH